MHHPGIHGRARPYRLILSGGEFTPSPEWYWNFWHREEARRGLDAAEDLFFPGAFTTQLELRSPRYFIASAEATSPASKGTDVLKSILGDGSPKA